MVVFALFEALPAIFEVVRQAHPLEPKDCVPEHRVPQLSVVDEHAKVTALRSGLHHAVAIRKCGCEQWSPITVGALGATS
jgi:hypothetical protein